jgi:hypothetical protein
MPKRKDPKQFFQRAREKGLGQTNVHIDGSEVRRRLEPKTRRAYQRQVDNWNQCRPVWGLTAADPLILHTLRVIGRVFALVTEARR